MIDPGYDPNYRSKAKGSVEPKPQSGRKIKNNSLSGHFCGPSCKCLVEASGLHPDIIFGVDVFMPLRVSVSGDDNRFTIIDLIGRKIQIVNPCNVPLNLSETSAEILVRICDKLNTKYQKHVPVL